MTPTAYIVTPITVPPIKEDWYYVMNPNKEILPKLMQFKDTYWDNHTQLNVSFWLRPIDLSRMLEEAWDAGAKSMKELLSVTLQQHKYLEKFNPEARNLLKTLGEMIPSFPISNKETVTEYINRLKP